MPKLRMGGQQFSCLVQKGREVDNRRLQKQAYDKKKKLLRGGLKANRSGSYFCIG